MAYILTLTQAQILSLDIAAARAEIDPMIGQSMLAKDINPRFDIQFQRDPTDPRELSEVPEIRLWFIRLDACYPWLPLILDWEAGELVRYAAMLVPHQFSPTEGIRYNPEALEIFVMHKVFVISQWLQQQGISSTAKLKFMPQMLGYELDDGLFELLH